VGGGSDLCFLRLSAEKRVKLKEAEFVPMFHGCSKLKLDILLGKGVFLRKERRRVEL